MTECRKCQHEIWPGPKGWTDAPDHPFGDVCTDGGPHEPDDG